jgi:3-deoxy-D-manno-octulosonate 8-phosphate phosphatase (KDO 8-P phosphatase)
LSSPDDLQAAARRIRLLSFDVDGVLTDGRIIYADDGREIKAFNVQDGTAIKMLAAAGIEIAILTGRQSPMVERRAAELGIRHLAQGLADKAPAFEALCAELHIASTETAHVGDDLADLPLFELCGFAISVPNGHPAVRARADHITETAGGEGVARELAELILRARGNWPY